MSTNIVLFVLSRLSLVKISSPMGHKWSLKSVHTNNCLLCHTGRDWRVPKRSLELLSWASHHKPCENYSDQITQCTFPVSCGKFWQSITVLINLQISYKALIAFHQQWCDVHKWNIWCHYVAKNRLHFDIFTLFLFYSTNKENYRSSRTVQFYSGPLHIHYTHRHSE